MQWPSYKHSDCHYFLLITQKCVIKETRSQTLSSLNFGILWQIDRVHGSKTPMWLSSQWYPCISLATTHYNNKNNIVIMDFIQHTSKHIVPLNTEGYNPTLGWCKSLLFSFHAGIVRNITPGCKGEENNYTFYTLLTQRIKINHPNYLHLIVLILKNLSM